MRAFALLQSKFVGVVCMPPETDRRSPSVPGAVAAVNAHFRARSPARTRENVMDGSQALFHLAIGPSPCAVAAHVS